MTRLRLLTTSFGGGSFKIKLILTAPILDAEAAVKGNKPLKMFSLTQYDN